MNFFQFSPQFYFLTHVGCGEQKTQRKFNEKYGKNNKNWFKTIAYSSIISITHNWLEKRPFTNLKRSAFAPAAVRLWRGHTVTSHTPPHCVKGFSRLGNESRHYSRMCAICVGVCLFGFPYPPPVQTLTPFPTNSRGGLEQIHPIRSMIGHGGINPTFFIGICIIWLFYSMLAVVKFIKWLMFNFCIFRCFFCEFCTPSDFPRQKHSRTHPF